MKDSIKVVKYKKSQINATSVKEVNFLIQDDSRFVPLTIDFGLDSYEFNFDCSSLNNWTVLSNSSLLTNYQALLNIETILTLCDDFDFSFNPENLFLDINNFPLILNRDLFDFNKSDVNDVAMKFKSLIGCTLNQNFTYDQFYKGGNSLLLKSKLTMAYVNLNTTSDILKQLNLDYYDLLEKLNTTIIEVDKSKVSYMKKWTYFCGGLSFVLLSVFLYMGVFKLNEIKSFNSANENYLKQDYVGVLSKLKGLEVNDMPTSTKYVLAISTVKNQGLESEKVSNILKDINAKDTNGLLEYWDYIGQDKFNNAIEVAGQNHNDGLLLYANIKYKDYIVNDKSLNQKQRDEQKKQVEGKIKELADLLKIKISN